MLTLLLASLLALAETPAHAQDAAAAQDAAEAAAAVENVTSQKIVVTSASADHVCGHLAGSKAPVCYPDDIGGPMKNIAVNDGMICKWSTAPGLQCTSSLDFYALIYGQPVDGQILSVALPPRTESDFSACAIRKDLGVTCWGGDEAVNEAPTLSAPTVIATTGKDACANADDTYVRCWGENSLGNSPYGARNLRKLAMSSDTVCGIDDFGLQCWGHGVHVPSDLARDGMVIDVAAIEGETCALTFEHQVVCWGSQVAEPPTLVLPIALSQMDGAICATDDNGVTCWGPAINTPRPASPSGHFYPGTWIDP